MTTHPLEKHQCNTLQKKCRELLHNNLFDLRPLIIFQYNNGKSGITLLKLLKVPKNTFYNIIHCFQNEDRIYFIRPTGHPEKFNIQDKRVMLR